MTIRDLSVEPGEDWDESQKNEQFPGTKRFSDIFSCLEFWVSVKNVLQKQTSFSPGDNILSKEFSFFRPSATKSGRPYGVMSVSS